MASHNTQVLRNGATNKLALETKVVLWSGVIAENSYAQSQTGRVFRHFAVLILGIAVGLIISNGRYWLAEPADITNSSRSLENSTLSSKTGLLPKAAPDNVTHTPKLKSNTDARITLITRSSYDKSVTESGLLLPGNNRLIVRLSSLLNVQTLEFESDSIGASDLAVVAIDGLNDLALLEIVTQGILTPSTPGARQQPPYAISKRSIILGNTYNIQTSTGRLRVIVDSKLTEFDDGTSGYPIRRNISTTDRLMPVFSIEDNELVGLAMPIKNEPARLRLIDKDVIESLAFDANKLPATSMSQLQQDFFRSAPLGILTQFEAHLASDNLEGMLEFGEQYLYGGWLPKREEMFETLNGVISRQLKAFQRTNNFLAAEQLFTTASSFLPRHSGMELTYFQIQLEQSKPFAVLTAARYWLQGKNEDNTKAWLALHHEAVFSALNAVRPVEENPNTLLTRAIEIDPTQADYYVARAEEFVRTFDYVAAISDFEQAIDLDPRLNTKLDREIERLLRRIDTPGTLRVPVARTGGVLTTQVLINGLPFNFVVDTGASRTAISTATMDYLRLAHKAFGSVPITTANGLTYARNLTLSKLDVSGATAHNLDAIVVEDLGSHDGLLGLDFLGAYQLDMDSTSGEILLTPY